MNPFRVIYGRLPYFILIPIWLLMMVGACVLAVLKNTRHIAAYIAVCSTSGLFASIAISTLTLIVFAKLPTDALGPNLSAPIFLLSYFGGIAMGGLLGMVLGFWWLYRFRARRSSELA